MFRPARRYLLVSLLVAALPRALRAAQAGDFIADYEALAREIAARYVYFSAETADRFRRARATLRPRVERAETVPAFADLLEKTLAILRDDQVTISERGSNPVRRVPGETDIWASWHGGAAHVEEVRVASDADMAGLKPGHIVRRIEGIAVYPAMQRMTEGTTSAHALNWALRHLLAGPWSGPFVLEVSEGEATRRLEIERRRPGPANGAAMALRHIGEGRDLGYLRLRNALGDPGFVAEFDAALALLRQDRALILDLRDLSGPGTRDVTRAVLGRFVDKEIPWQVREDRDGKRVIDVAAPREPRARVPLIALVDRWTAGEGESLAAGLAAAGATLIGTRMAGMGGEPGEVLLPVSGVTVRFPVERVLLPNGTPREALRPAVPVDLAAPSGGPGDPILYQALKLLEK